MMSYLPEGGLKEDLPYKVRPKSGYANSYGRLWWNKPSTTITRNFGTPSSARCIHPKTDRALTTREGARLQSFPDHFLNFMVLELKKPTDWKCCATSFSKTNRKKYFQMS